MKLSLFLSALILLAGWMLGRREQQQLIVLQNDHHQLLKEAAALGLDVEALKNGKSSKQNRQRDELAKQRLDPKDVAQRMAAFALEMKKRESGEQEEDPNFRMRVIAIINDVVSLDAAQLRTLVEELKNNPNLDEELRGDLMRFAIMTLGESHPETALVLYIESFDLSKNEGRHREAIAEGLGKWAQKDPIAALEWMRAQGQKYPALFSDSAKQKILSGAAKHDPKLAFKLIGELQLKEPGEAGDAITRLANTSEQRTAVLSALRDHLKTNADAKTNQALAGAVLQKLTCGVVKEGYATATRWLEQAQLTPEEKASFVNNLRYAETKENTGKWLDWMAKEAPSVDKAKSTVDYMVQQWTGADHKAVGTWLNETPDTQVRQIATRAYAYQVARHEPQTAALWAKTLPAGKERADAMQHIYREWKKQDESAAAAFAREQGVKE